MRRLLFALIAVLFLASTYAFAQAPVPGVLIANPAPGTGAKFCGFTSVGATPILCGSGIASGGLASVLAYARNVPVNITIVGDEFAVSDQTNNGAGPTLSVNRWAERLRVALQGQYNSAGTGIVPLWGKAVDVSTSAGINVDTWSCSGPLTNTITTAGPSQAGHGALINIPTGSSCTFNDVRGIVWDTGVVFCLPSATAGTGLSVSIDGGATQQICASTASPTPQVVTLPKVASSSAHTVVFNGNGASLYGFEGIDSSHSGGIAVSNLGIAGATAAAFGSSPATQMAFSDEAPGGVQFVLLAEGQANDALAGTAAATYQAQLTAIVAHVGNRRAALVLPPQNVVSTYADLSSYIAAEANVCAAANVPCANLAAMWGTYSPSTGQWDESGDTDEAWQPSDTFGVLPSDTGNFTAFQTIAATITQ